MQIKPVVSRSVAVPFRQAFNVGSDSVKVIIKYCDPYKYRHSDLRLILLETFCISPNYKVCADFVLCLMSTNLSIRITSKSIL